MEASHSRTLSDRSRALLQAGLFGLVLLSPLPFGSVEPWPVLVLELWASALLALALALAWRHGGVTWPAPVLLGLAAVPWLVGLAQLLPLPRALATAVVEPTAAARAALREAVPEAEPPWLAASLSPPETLDAWLRLGSYLAIALVAAVAVSTRRDLRRLAMAAGLGGVAQALYGAGEYLTGHQHIFGYAKKYYLESATGTFINRNHYAGYLALCLPLALGLALEARESRLASRGWRARVLAFFEHGGLLRSLAFLATAVIWIGVFLSYSRGGLAAALVATAVVAFVSARRRRLAALFLVCLVPAGWLCWQEVKAPGERFLTAEEGELATLSRRLPAWRAAVRMVPHYLALGSGHGTFESAFPPYKSADLGARWDHAHNDWLEMLIEGGVPTAAAALVLLGVIAARTARRLAPGARDALPLGCLLAGLAGAAFHALFDFAPRIPAVAVLVAVQAGALAGRISVEPRAARPAVVPWAEDESSAYIDPPARGGGPGRGAGVPC